MNDFIFDSNFTTGPYFMTPSPGFVQAQKDHWNFQDMRRGMAYYEEDDYDEDELSEALESLTTSDTVWLDRLCAVNSFSEGFKNELLLGIFDVQYDDCRNETPEWRAWVRNEIKDYCRRMGCTPILDPDTIQFDPFTTKDEGQGNMELSMTVNRAKLVEALKAKRDEVKEQLQTKVDEAKKKVEDAQDSDSVVKYLEKLTQLVKDGKVSIFDYHGRQKGERRAETLLNIYAVNKEGYESAAKVLPAAPQRTNEQDSVAHLTNQLARAETNLKNATAPYDAALQLLEMSVDENVGIPASEYQRLLAGTPQG